MIHFGLFKTDKAQEDFHAAMNDAIAPWIKDLDTISILAMLSLVMGDLIAKARDQTSEILLPIDLATEVIYSNILHGYREAMKSPDDSAKSLDAPTSPADKGIPMQALTIPAPGEP